MNRDAFVFWSVVVFTLGLIIFSTGYSTGFTDGNSVAVNKGACSHGNKED